MIKARLFWKVLANFGLLLIVLTAMTVLTLSVLTQIEKSFNIAKEDTKVLRGVERLRNYLVRVPAAANQYLATGSAAERLLYNDGWKEFDGVVSEVQRATTDSMTLEALASVRLLFNGWVEKVGDRKIALRADSMAAKSIDKQLQEIAAIEAQEQQIGMAESLLREISRRRISSQPENLERATSRTIELRKYISLVNVLFAVFALALGFVLTRSITTPVRMLKQGTQGIMSGKYEQITLHRSDELGELAADFNKMSAMLGNNYTRLNAYSELVTALNTHEGMSQISFTSVELLCQHAKAAIGALYVLEPATNVLYLESGFGLKQGGLTVKSFMLGEGIPGQSASSRKTLEVSDVEMSKGFVVDTGLVEVVPRHVISVPIFFQDKLVGVIILGNMTPFSDLQKEIIDNSVPQIGVAITNARNYEATQKLSREVAGKNDELNSKNAELEKAYRVKSDFLSGMSHELRTPLNSIIGFTTVLLGPGGDPLSDDQRKALEKVLKSGKHLLQLINDILDFSKIESGRLTVAVESDEVENVVSTALITVESMARSKNLQLVQRIEPGVPMLHTDVLKVKQILLNLLSNAVKFTDNGEVGVHVSQKDGLLYFAVKDTGIGIEQKNFGKVFEEFQQIDSSDSRKYKGTGLGLAISRRLARMLGGDLIFESEYGKGTTFTLTLPPVYQGKEETIAAPPKPEPPKAEMPRPAGDIAAPPRPLAVSEIKKTMVRTNGVKVLCIDDDPDVIEILRQYLLPEGYSVLEALSGDEGIKKAEEFRPDLITLDIMMPGKDGWQTLRELKMNATTRDIPVVIHSMIDNKPLAMSLGALDVLTKPAEQKRLIALVQKIVSSKEQTVLVVDENEVFSSAIKRTLEEEGYNAVTAKNSSQMITRLREKAPAMIFLDPVMPDRDAIQVMKELRENTVWKQIPVVVVSHRELSQADLDALQLNVIEWVKKGEFNADSISSAIKKILQKV